MQRLSLPGGRYELLELPNGTQVHLDRRSGASKLFLDAPHAQKHFIAGPLTKENSGRKAFAVFDETGRLYRIDPDALASTRRRINDNQLVFGLQSHDRIGHILGPRGQFMVLDWDGTRISSVTTNHSHIAFAKSGNILIHGFLGNTANFDFQSKTIVTSPARKQATMQRLPDPHALRRKLSTGRFYRQAWELIEANQRKLMTNEMSFEDWERYWTEGKYEQEEYYQNLGKMPPLRRLVEHANFTSAGEHLDQQINATLLTAVSWFADGLSLLTDRHPITQYPADYLFSSIKHQLEGRADPSVRDDLVQGLDRFGTFMDVVSTSHDVFRAGVDALDNSWERPVRLTRVDVAREYWDEWIIAYRTPSEFGLAQNFRFERVVESFVVSEVFPWQVNWNLAAKHFGRSYADIYAGKMLSRMIEEETQHHARPCFPNCRTRTKALQDLLKPEVLFGEGIGLKFPPSTHNNAHELQSVGGVEIQTVSKVRNGNLGALRNRLKGCQKSRESHCEVLK